MALTAAQVTVTTTETSLAAATVGGLSVIVRHAGGAPGIFLGQTGVTVSNGFELPQGETVTIRLNANEELFGIVAAATEEANVISS